MAFMTHDEQTRRYQAAWLALPAPRPLWDTWCETVDEHRIAREQPDVVDPTLAHRWREALDQQEVEQAG